MSAPQRRRRDRGAVLPEYALVIALIVVASIGAISKAQDAGKSRLDVSDTKISPADQAYYPGAPSTTTSVPGSTTTTVGPIAVHLKSGPVITVADDGQRWLTTITFTVVDSSGNGVIGATMNGTWSDGGGGSNPTSTCTTSSAAGSCTVQFTKIKDSNKTVTYTLSTISGGTFTWVPSAGGEGTVTVTCGNPIC